MTADRLATDGTAKAGDIAPLVVMVAPNGARKTKADHLDLPMTVAEIARTAARCGEAGAAAIHLHVRGADGGHVLDAELYCEALAAIRAEADDGIVAQVTTEAVGRYAPAEQMEVVRRVRPEFVSLAVRELIGGAAEEPEAARFFSWMRLERIAPQFIVYDAADLTRLTGLIGRGVVPWRRPFVLFVLGRYAAGQKSEPNDMLPFLPHAPSGSPWMVCAFGAKEAASAVCAAALGGHARVGFENNLLRPDGSVAADNAEQVARIVAGAATFGRAPAGAEDLREMLAALD